VINLFTINYYDDIADLILFFFFKQHAHTDALHPLPLFSPSCSYCFWPVSERSARTALSFTSCRLSLYTSWIFSGWVSYWTLPFAN